jgi:ABC-type antimicrobial peptide transport system permease subunit
MLGIVIGVAAIILILAAGAGAQDRIAEQIGASGPASSSFCLARRRRAVRPSESGPAAR